MDGKQNSERQSVALHECRNFLLFFLHDGEQRQFLFAGVVTGNPVVLAFLLGDFVADGQRLDIDGDGEVQEAQAGQPMNQSGMSHLGPAGQDDHGMIMPVHPEPKIGLSIGLAVPAVVLDRKRRVERFQRVVVEPFAKGRVEERGVMPVMVGGGHGNNPRSLS